MALSRTPRGPALRTPYLPGALGCVRIFFSLNCEVLKIGTAAEPPLSYPQNLGYLLDHWPEAPCATPKSASVEQKPGSVHQSTIQDPWKGLVTSPLEMPPATGKALGTPPPYCSGKKENRSIQKHTLLAPCARSP